MLILFRDLSLILVIASTHCRAFTKQVWNQEFDFEITNEIELEVEVMDREVVGNDKFMGRAKVNILDWIATGSFEGNIELLDKSDKPAGSLTLSARFTRPPDSSKAESNGENDPPRDPNGTFTDEEIRDSFRAFDLDKNNYVGAAEIRHILINIGERVTDEEVSPLEQTRVLANI